jgi:hypothetical protein
MAEAAQNNKVDMSATALEIAKSTGFGSDEAKFKEFEKEFIRSSTRSLDSRTYRTSS